MALPWPFNLGFEFRKAKTFDPQEVCNLGVDLVCEEKLDGWRVLIVCDEKGDEHCYSRGVATDTGLPIDLLERHGDIKCLKPIFDAMLPRSAIEGELLWPEHFATDVPTALKDCPHALKVNLYAFPWESGSALSCWYDERRLLESMFKREMLAPYGPGVFTYDAFIRGVYSEPNTIVDPSFRNAFVEPELLTQYAVTNGVEGYIIKEARGSRWWKFKLEHTMDLVVIGTTDAREGVTGKYLGLVGALVVGRVVGVTPIGAPILDSQEPADITLDYADLNKTLWIREVARISGMDDEQREQMSAERDDLIGRVCEVKAQAKGGKFRLRHPRFIRWREDKPAWECV